jgi:hypothetical protein
MSITIKHTVYGFHVLVVCDDRARFADAIEALKTLIPKKNRRYHQEGRYWSIDKRREKKLREWVEWVRQMCEIRVFEVSRVESLVSAKAA